MSVVTGYILGCAIVVLGACALTAFAFWLGARDEKERASRPVILRVDSYRVRQQ